MALFFFGSYTYIRVIEVNSLMLLEKAILIDALRKEHPLKNLLDCVHMKRSSFFYHCCKGLRKDKYSTLKRQIINLFEANGRCVNAGINLTQTPVEI